MSMYITSTIDQEYAILGVELPKQSYSTEELHRGKRLVVTVPDQTYEKLIANRIFKGMVDGGQYIVSSEKPINKMNEMELEHEAMKASKEAKDLKEKLDKAEKLVGKLTSEVADLKAETQSLVNDLKRAAEEIAEKDTRIGELEIRRSKK